MEQGEVRSEEDEKPLLERTREDLINAGFPRHNFEGWLRNRDRMKNEWSIFAKKQNPNWTIVEDLFTKFIDTEEIDLLTKFPVSRLGKVRHFIF